MVATLSNLIRIAELAARAGQAVAALKKTGNGEAAAVLERECNAACKQIVRAARNRRGRANRARKQTRGLGGRFIG